LKERLRADLAASYDEHERREAERARMRVTMTLSLDELSMLAHGLAALEREYRKHARVAPERRRDDQLMWWTFSELAQLTYRIRHGMPGAAPPEATSSRIS
jgi:hypothetical protein